MKSIITKSCSCFLLLLTIWACSSDPVLQEEVNSSSRENFIQKSGGVWNGIVGQEINGQYVVTADQGALKVYLQNILKREGISVSLQTIQIEKKIADNNPLDTAFMLIGSTSGIGNRDTSIGIMLTQGSSGFFISPTLNGGPQTSTSCRGCTSGCNLSYYTINGKKVPYCNENGCSIYNCEKSETEL